MGIESCLCKTLKRWTVSEIYISTDIETDGMSPGRNSMLAFASVAFKLDKTVVSTFERNLKPLPKAKPYPPTMRWWSDYPEAWGAISENPVEPSVAMHEYVEWLEQFQVTPVFVAHPVGFDHTFIWWYLYEFVGKVWETPFGTPFGQGILDISSYAMAVLKRPINECTMEHLPKEWFDPDLPHTHKPLDDAMQQAMLLCNIVSANMKSGTNRGSDRLPSAR